VLPACVSSWQMASMSGSGRNGASSPTTSGYAMAGPSRLPGLWERWAPPDDQPLDSCTIITTVANDLIRPLHVRMPVILDPDAYAPWLDTALRDHERLQPLLHPYPPEGMEVYPVSPRVNNPVNDTSACQTAISDHP
jgi:putative SOS response-associated peptidase YedK